MAFSTPLYIKKSLVQVIILKNYVSLKMSTKLFINAFSSLFNLDRDKSIVRVRLTPSFFKKIL